MSRRAIHITCALTPFLTMLGTGGLGRAFFQAAPEPPEDMVAVPAGEFSMGDDAGLADQTPSHPVYLDAFYIGKTEVTNGQYHAFWVVTGGERSPHTPKSFGGEFGYWPEVAQTKPTYPVVGVNWSDALAYARWRGCRLPTEAEWEKAARGANGSAWPWGGDFTMEIRGRSLHANVWNGGDGYDNRPAPVGSFPTGASRAGAFDVAGNVAEWVGDWYSDSFYLRSPTRDPKGPEEGTWRVVRGGSWASDADAARVSVRAFQHPADGASFIGFRLAKSAD